MGKPLVTWLLRDEHGPREVVVKSVGSAYGAWVTLGEAAPTEYGLAIGIYSECYEAAFSYVSRFYLGLNVARAYDL